MTWATDRLDEIRNPDATRPPVVETLRLGLLDDWGPGWVKKRWEPCPEVLNGDGSLFGGYLAALADQVSAFAAMTVVADDTYFRTVNLQMSFLKIGVAQPLDIEARVVGQTRQLITLDTDFRRPDGQLIARATAQQMTLPKLG